MLPLFFMIKNSSYKSYINNLNFVRSSDNWVNLNIFSKSIKSSLPSKSNFVDRLNLVENKMRKSLCDDSWMGHCAKYQLQSGGKRFRALLALITADIFKLDKKSSVDLAVCCEFIHNASLIHDDLQDRDLLRRGLPTIWNRFGDHTAINLGDYFISGSFEILTKINVNPEYKCIAIAELSKIIKQTLKGQSLEILGRSDFDLRMQDYESTAKAKTGGLICLPIKLVMILMGKKFLKIILNHFMKLV